MTRGQVNPNRLALTLSLSLAAPWVVAGAGVVGAAEADVLTRGRAIAFDPAKGNCLACHQIDGGESPGDVGPALVAIGPRFPNKRLLREQLWDPMAHYPRSRMPPFGRHRILTEDELDMVVEYLYSL
jgi:sulfur-oxidizing protein SoxX